MKLFNVWTSSGHSTKEWIVQAVNEFDAKVKVYEAKRVGRDISLGVSELDFSASKIYSINLGEMV